MKKERNYTVRIFFWMMVIVAATFFCSMPVNAKEENVSYKMQKMTALLDHGGIQNSSKEITMKKDEKAKGIFFSGKAEQFHQALFSFTKTFNFDQQEPGYVVVDGLAAKGENVKVELYLDNETQAFASINLVRQRRKDKWTYENSQMADISDQKLSGEHKISFKIVNDGEGSTKTLIRSIEFMKNEIPVVSFQLDESQGSIEAMNNDSSHETECYGTMSIKIPENYQSEYTDKKLKSETYELDYIRGRGNSTWMQDKKPYKIKLDKKADLLGMGANKHWVLLANRLDNSLLRNKGTYWLGQQLGMAFTPKSEFVDVFVNGTYYGSYCLSEQVRVGKTRVNIPDLEENDASQKATDEATISGGYLLSLEPYGDEEKKSFVTSHGTTFLIESPSFEDYKNDAQYNYIKKYVQKTEDAIYGKNFKDSSGKSYEDYMDVKTAIDYYWIQEISQNGDGFVTTSTYLYKDRGGKLCWGPLWDFDYVAWGDTDYSKDVDCKGWIHKDSMWFQKLFQDKKFAKKAVERWPVIREKLKELYKDGGQLDQYAKKVGTSEGYDFEKWGFMIFDDDIAQCKTYKEEVERLKLWIKKRTQWIDKNINTLIPKECKVVFKNGKKVCETQTLIQGTYLTQMPKNPSKKGYVFTGWYDKEGIRYTKGMGIEKNLTLTAGWIRKNQVVKAKNIYFQMSDIYVNLDDESYYPAYCVMPDNTTFDEVKLKSGDKKIATIQKDGGIALKKKGTVTITAYTSGNKVKASFRLHIKTNVQYPDRFSISKKTTLEKGNYKQLPVTLYPKESVIPQFFWKSTDEKIATVDNFGIVRGRKAGNATIILSSDGGGEVAYCKVTVKKGTKKRK